MHGLVTAIGSLPHLDAHAAARFALRSSPDLPAAPSLPMRSGRESMVAQGWPARGVAIAEDGSVAVEAGLLDPEQPFEDGDGAPVGPSFAGFVAFLDELRATTSPPASVKVQTIGPATLAIALERLGAPPRTARTVAARAVSQRAVAMVDAVRSITGSAVVVVLDEPAPCGSATDEVAATIDGIRPWADLVGVHCCGPAGWPSRLRVGADVVFVPVALAGALPPAELAAHLRTGWVAWGAVPTDRVVADDVEPLWQAMGQTWSALRVDRDLVVERSLVTPACGLAGHTVEEATVALRLCHELAARCRTP